MCENIKNNIQKTKKVELNEKDIKILNLIKKFLTCGMNAEITDKEVHDYCKTMRWINRNFFKKENNYAAPDYRKTYAEKIRNSHCCQEHQRMGHGKMKGLSGLTWDFSKMTEDDANYMKRCLEADIAHDKLMHPEKYAEKNIYDKNPDCCCKNPYNDQKHNLKMHPAGCCDVMNHKKDDKIGKIFGKVADIIKNLSAPNPDKRKDFSFDELFKLARDFKKDCCKPRHECHDKAEKDEILNEVLLDLLKILKRKLLRECLHRHHDKHHCHCHCHDHHHEHECHCGCHGKHKKEISLIKVGNIINILKNINK